MRCDTCIYWSEQQDSEWEATLGGFRKCTAVKTLWKIQDESTDLLNKYPDNEPTVEVDFDIVGKRWHDAFKAGLENEKAFVQDASQYRAELYTGPDFFCAKYKEKEGSCPTT